jgi:hypothetical protein
MTAQARNFRNILAAIGLAAAATIGWPLGAKAQDAGVVSHINIVSDKSEDISSPEAWKKTYIKDGMSDQDKAIAVWRTVTKYRHQDNPPSEGLEGDPEKGNGNVHEPFKTFQVYGYGMCCCASADVEGLSRYIGLTARGREIANHSVPEVWYDNAWHLFDSSLMFYLLKPDGSAASVDDMKADIMAWRKANPGLKNDTDLKNFSKDEGWKKNGPTLFATCQFYDKDGINGAGWHGWWSNMTEYNYKPNAGKIVVPPDTKPEPNVFDYGAIMGYELNVQLRQGEKLTRCWTAKEAATGLNRKNPKAYERFLAGDRSALGLQRTFGDMAPGRIGNGTLEYDAMADSKLPVDALACENLTVANGKIRITDPAKPASLIVRMPCSYLYLSGEMTSKPIVGDGGSITASISLNNGLDWKELAKFDPTMDKSADQKSDLKPFIFNKYDYRVKFDFAGAGAGLDELKFTNNVQHSQAPLPTITDGANKINFSAGAPDGTVTVEGNMTGPSDKALWIGDFHPIVDGCEVKRFAVGSTGHGSAIVPIATPGDITHVRLGVHWRAREAADGYTVQASFDNGSTWKEIGKLDLGNPAKSTYLVFSDVPAGSKSVQVKFDGTQKNTACIFDLRIDVDYKEPAGGFHPVKVTYTWEEGVPAAPAAAKGAKKPAAADQPHGSVKTDVHVCATPTDSWTITCGAGTVPTSYTVELAK